LRRKRRGIEIDAAPGRNADQRPVRQHVQAVERPATLRFGRAQQRAARRVATHVGADDPGPHAPPVEIGVGVDIGEKTDGGGIDQACFGAGMGPLTESDPTL
jgi:hypothetical protein